MTTTSRPTHPQQTRTGNPNDRGLDLRSAIGGVRQRTPRRLGQWAAAVLFIVIVVLGLLALFQSQSDRVEVLAVTRNVPAGQVIKDGDLRPLEVAGVSGAIAATDIDTVVGKRAAAGLVEGQVLTDAALTDELVPGETERVVAIALPVGRVPGGLSVGDVVSVIVVPVEGAEGASEQLRAPVVLSQAASVQSVGDTPEGGRVVTVLVDASEADQIAAYSAAGQVTIVQAPITSRDTSSDTSSDTGGDMSRDTGSDAAGE